MQPLCLNIFRKLLELCQLCYDYWYLWMWIVTWTQLVWSLLNFTTVCSGVWDVWHLFHPGQMPYCTILAKVKNNLCICLVTQMVLSWYQILYRLWYNTCLNITIPILKQYHSKTQTWNFKLYFTIKQLTYIHCTYVCYTNITSTENMQMCITCCVLF